LKKILSRITRFLFNTFYLAIIITIFYPNKLNKYDYLIIWILIICLCLCINDLLNLRKEGEGCK
jgi:ABC-type polysaccharide/polyol phosphate export permease